MRERLRGFQVVLLVLALVLGVCATALLAVDVATVSPGELVVPPGTSWP
jgi:hypothetical protein